MKDKSVYGWFVVAMLWAAVTLNYLDRLAVFTIFPLLRRELGMSDLELGLVGSVFLWVYGGLSPFVGYLGDRLSRQRVILGSLLVWSLVTFATGLARSPAEMILLRGMMGVSEACYMPAALALIADYHSPSSRSTAIGLHQSGIYVGSVLGGVLPGYLANHWGWRFGFQFLGVLGMLLASLLVVFLRDAPRGAGDLDRRSRLRRAPAGTLGENFRVLLKIPTVAILCLVVMIFSVYFWVFSAWLPLFFYEKFHMSLTKAGLTASAYIQAGSVVGVLVGGLVADRSLKRDERARMWVQWAGILVPAPFLFLIGWADSLTYVALALLVFGVGRGLWDCNNMPIIADVTTAETRATAYGAFNCWGMLGGGLGTLLVGLLAPRLGLGVLLSATAPLALLGGTIVWVGATRFLANDTRRLQDLLRESRE